MINPSIDSIIFDFGGVLININYLTTIEAFKQLGIDDFDAMYSQAAQSDLFNDIETGKITPDAFVNGLLEYLPAGTTPQNVIDAWNAMILDVPQKSIDIIKALKQKGYKVFLLSNTNSIHIEKAFEEWEKVSPDPAEALMDHVYLSHEINMRKPNKEIFEFVCTEQSLDPKRTLFIDDSIQHIKGAQEVGLQTHHLLPTEDLSTILNLD